MAILGVGMVGGMYAYFSTDFKTHFGITDTSIGEHNSGRVYFAGGGGGIGGSAQSSVGG